MPLGVSLRNLPSVERWVKVYSEAGFSNEQQATDRRRTFICRDAQQVQRINVIFNSDKNRRPTEIHQIGLGEKTAIDMTTCIGGQSLKCVHHSELPSYGVHNINHFVKKTE